MIKTAQHAILSHCLTLMQHQGMSHALLEQASVQAGYAPLYYYTVFDTLEDVAHGLMEALDEQMLAACQDVCATIPSIRTRIYTIITRRIALAKPHISAYRQLHYFMARPCHVSFATACHWRTADHIWRLAGDASTDFNYYTKRGLLLAVYCTTWLYWLQDSSAEQRDTDGFLKRRIDNALSVGRFKQKISGFFKTASLN